MSKRLFIFTFLVSILCFSSISALGDFPGSAWGNIQLCGQNINWEPSEMTSQFADACQLGQQGSGTCGSLTLKAEQKSIVTVDYDVYELEKGTTILLDGRSVALQSGTINLGGLVIQGSARIYNLTNITLINGIFNDAQSFSDHELTINGKNVYITYNSNPKNTGNSININNNELNSIHISGILDLILGDTSYSLQSGTLDSFIENADGIDKAVFGSNTIATVNKAGKIFKVNNGIFPVKETLSTEIHSPTSLVLIQKSKVLVIDNKGNMLNEDGEQTQTTNEKPIVKYESLAQNIKDNQEVANYFLNENWNDLNSYFKVLKTYDQDEYKLLMDFSKKYYGEKGEEFSKIITSDKLSEPDLKRLDFISTVSATTAMKQTEGEPADFMKGVREITNLVIGPYTYERYFEVDKYPSEQELIRRFGSEEKAIEYAKENIPKNIVMAKASFLALPVQQGNSANQQIKERDFWFAVAREMKIEKKEILSAASGHVGGAVLGMVATVHIPGPTQLIGQAGKKVGKTIVEGSADDLIKVEATKIDATEANLIRGTTAEAIEQAEKREISKITQISDQEIGKLLNELAESNADLYGQDILLRDLVREIAKKTKSPEITVSALTFLKKIKSSPDLERKYVYFKGLIESAVKTEDNSLALELLGKIERLQNCREGTLMHLQWILDSESVIAKGCKVGDYCGGFVDSQAYSYENKRKLFFEVVDFLDKTEGRVTPVNQENLVIRMSKMNNGKHENFNTFANLERNLGMLKQKPEILELVETYKRADFFQLGFEGFKMKLPNGQIADNAAIIDFLLKNKQKILKYPENVRSGIFGGRMIEGLSPNLELLADDEIINFVLKYSKTDTNHLVMLESSLINNDVNIIFSPRTADMKDLVRTISSSAPEPKPFEVGEMIDLAKPIGGLSDTPIKEVPLKGLIGVAPLSDKIQRVKIYQFLPEGEVPSPDITQGWLDDSIKKLELYIQSQLGLDAPLSRKMNLEILYNVEKKDLPSIKLSVQSVVDQISRSSGRKIVKNFPIAKEYGRIAVTLGTTQKKDFVEATQRLVMGLISKDKEKLAQSMAYFDLNAQKLKLARDYAVSTFTGGRAAIVNAIGKERLTRLNQGDRQAAEEILDFLEREIVAKGATPQKVEPLSDLLISVRGLKKATSEIDFAILRTADVSTKETAINSLFGSEDLMCCAFYPKGGNKWASVGYAIDPDLGLLQLNRAIVTTSGVVEKEPMAVAIFAIVKDNSGKKVLLIDSVEGGATIELIQDRQWKDLFFEGIQKFGKEIDADYIAFNSNKWDHYWNSLPKKFKSYLENVKSLTPQDVVLSKNPTNNVLVENALEKVRVQNNAPGRYYLDSFERLWNNGEGGVVGAYIIPLK